MNERQRRFMCVTVHWLFYFILVFICWLFPLGLVRNSFGPGRTSGVTGSTSAMERDSIQAAATSGVGGGQTLSGYPAGAALGSVTSNCLRWQDLDELGLQQEHEEGQQIRERKAEQFPVLISRGCPLIALRKMLKSFF